MKKLLNTLYVTTQGSFLSRDGETVRVRLGESTKLNVPIHTLDGIVCFGQVSCSPPLMQLCGERDVTLSFLSEYGRFWARVQGPVSGNVLLRRAQYRMADDEIKSCDVARNITLGKIANSRNVILRAMRDHADSVNLDQMEKAVMRLARIIDSIKSATSIDVVRGLEGDAARTYFSVFDNLVIVQKSDFFFRARSRRPPLDSLNALLSFVYTLVHHDVVSAIESVGLDPAVGYLHRDRPGRAGLGLDLMEELRPYVADRLVLSMINRLQVKGAGFRTTESGAVLMDDATRKQVLVAYQKRKQDEIGHPFLDEKIPIGLLPFAQALLFARFVRGDLDGYPAFVSK